MNPYKYNSTARTFLTRVICENLEIPHTDIYKTVHSFDGTTLKINGGKKYKVILEEIE